MSQAGCVYARMVKLSVDGRAVERERWHGLQEHAPAIKPDVNVREIRRSIDVIVPSLCLLASCLSRKL